MRNGIKKTLFLIILTLCMLLILGMNQVVNADEVTKVKEWDVSADDNKSKVTATLYSNGSFVISGTGDMKSFSETCEYADYRKDIKIIEIKNGVTSIGSKAFESCTSLTSIEIPDSVSSIGNFAFEQCTSLTSIIIPDSVTSIGYVAFNSCTSLTSIEIPDSVTSIQWSVFNYCKSLTEIKVAEDNKNYSSEEGVLFNKDKTEIIKYPEGKTENSYTIPTSVTSIESDAFSRCKSLKSIEIPTSVTRIGRSAFEDCTSLASVTIGNSVTSIEDMAFNYCKSLTEIKVAEDNKNYSSEEGVLFNKDKTEIIKYPEGKTDNSYTIPNSVTSIEKYAFYYCTSLTSIEIPDSVTSIESCAFCDCTSLASVTIGNSVTSIKYRAFYYCTSLASITIGNSVTSIGEYAFTYCRSLTSIEISNNVTKVGSYAFKNCTSLTKLYIPKTITQMGKDIVDGDNDINVYVTSNSYAKTYVEENKIKYQIDDIAPTVNVERLQKGRISEFEVKAEDKDSGLATYAYSTDGITYVKDNKITIPADKEKITVYVIDKVGNVEETTIEKYKEIEENGLGDVNDDGKIDDKDVDMIKQYTSKSIELTEDQKVRADVNKDGTVDEVDEEELTKYIQLQKPEDDNTTGKDDNTTGKDDNTTGKDDNTTGKDYNTTGKDDNTTGGTEDSKNQNNGEETKNPQSNSGNVKKYSSTTNVNSAKSLPYAGATPIILIGAIICSIIGVIGFVGYRKYRKIK